MVFARACELADNACMYEAGFAFCVYISIISGRFLPYVLMRSRFKKNAIINKDDCWDVVST